MCKLNPLTRGSPPTLHASSAYISTPGLALQDARDVFRDKEEQAAQGSPKRKHDAKQEARLQEEAKKRRIEEAMKSAEAQMQKTFLPKIFKGHEDLRKLEQVALAEDQQKRRAAFRAKQLMKLEKRKLDCRVSFLGIRPWIGSTSLCPSGKNMAGPQEWVMHRHSLAMPSMAEQFGIAAVLLLW